MLKDVSSSPTNEAGAPDVSHEAPNETIADQIEKSLYTILSPLASSGYVDATLEAYSDWASHLIASPSHQTQLVAKALKAMAQLSDYAIQRSLGDNQPAICIEPRRGDHRFSDPEWRSFPYDVIAQNFLVLEEWWREAASSVSGVSKKHRDFVAFSLLQILDSLSPYNSPLTNPVIHKRIADTKGACLLNGVRNISSDLRRIIRKERPEGADAYKIGADIAATPGKIIFRNRLMELIQYSPSTDRVHPEPILIVPAWIMKYYILDLEPQNSLVAYLVSQGFTVFAISWVNPTEDERDLSLNDYRTDGVLAAFEVIKTVIPRAKIHAVGYCLGGTLLCIAAAAMARDGTKALQTISLFAAQTDFSEPGELSLFISDAQIRSLEHLMQQRGYLDSAQMSGAFQALRANDLVWSKIVHEYWMGEREPMSPMMAWNTDGTRMPYRMHSEYLRELFLNNALARGNYQIDGHTISLRDISAPIFAIGTEQDHVAPWRSVYKINNLVSSDVTFALTNGGHNAGIISEPGHRGRRHRLLTQTGGAPRLDQNAYLTSADSIEGSWWPSWVQWLSTRSTARVPPPEMGRPSEGFAPLCDAPGAYVLQA